MSRAKGVYSTEDLKKVFEHATTRGIVLGSMVSRGATSNEDVKVFKKYFPDFEDFINSDKFKDK